MNRNFVRLGICALLIAVIGVGTPAWAVDSAPLEIKSIKVGLAGRFQLGNWTPVSATVVASGSAPASARLVVIAPDADGQLVRTAGPHQQFTPGQPETLHARFLSGRATGEITVRIEVLNGSAIEERFHPRASAATSERAPELLPPFRQEVPFWAMCGLSPSIFDAAMAKSPEDLAKSSSSAEANELLPERIALSPTDLPDDAADLAAVDVLILAATAMGPGSEKLMLAELSATQQRALREWVEVRGGHLVLSVGSHRDAFQQSELGKWLKLPLKNEIAIRQLDGLESYSPHPSVLKIEGTVPVIPLENTAGNVLARSLDGPLLVQIPYGFGRVSFLGVDLQHPAVAKWEGLGHLLRKLLSTEREQKRSTRTQGAQLAKSSVNDLSSQLFAALEEFPGIVRLSLWSVMLLLGIYILIVGPLDYVIVHRWLKRPQLTWLTLTMWVVLGSALVVGLSNQLNGTRLRATQLDLVDLDESSQLLRGTSWVTIYSPKTARSPLELAKVSTHLAQDGQIESSVPMVSWIAPPENRIGGLYREGGVQLSQREYRTLETSADGGAAGVGYADVPLQVWSTQRFGGEWSAKTNRLVESKLVSSELGRLTGTIEHHFADTLTDCLLAYANRVYMPVLRRAGGKGKSDLTPHFVWEIGGGQPVEQRELRSYLTQVFMREVQRTSTKSTELLDIQTPYDPTKRELDYIVRMLTFHQAAGGRDYTGLRHDTLASSDMSTQLRLGRAVLLGKLKKPSAEWKVRGEVLVDDSVITYVRIVLPVDREKAAEAKAIPKPDEDLPKTNK